MWAASASFNAGSQDRFEGFIDDLESVVEAASPGDVATVLRTVRSEVGLDRAAALLDGSRSAADRSGHTDDLDALAQLCALHPNAASFETWLEGLLARPASPNGVTLSTIHKVKGMEWPKVIVAPVRQGQMPHRLADDLEEERRVFHVAITRGIDEAVVLGDAAHPSRFLDELFDAPAASPTQPARQPKPAEHRYHYPRSVSESSGVATGAPSPRSSTTASSSTWAAPPFESRGMNR